MMKLTKITALLIALVAFTFGCQKNCPITVPVVVDAGNYDTVELPTDSLVLAGTVQSGATQNMTYLWTVVSGPNLPVFASDTAATTKLSSLVAGRYVLQFQATNSNGETGLDTTSIVVKQGPTTLTLQPADNSGETVMVQLNGGNQRTGYSPESFIVSAWTSGGLPYNTRMAIKFDLSTIPRDAKIVNATLFLYSNPKPDNGNLIDANFGTDNSMVLRQITSPWDSTTISFNNPPVATIQNEVNIPSTTSSFLDLNLDVTAMVASMVNNNANYGFYAKLNNEIQYTDRCFVSSHNPYYPDKYPKLVVTYK